MKKTEKIHVKMYSCEKTGKAVNSSPKNKERRSGNKTGRGSGNEKHPACDDPNITKNRQCPHDVV